MGKFLDKVTGALGFTKSYDDDYDEYDEYDDYEELDAPKPVTPAPSYNRTPASAPGRYNSSSMSSRYESRSTRPEAGTMNRVQYSTPSYASAAGASRGNNKIVNLNAQFQLSVVVSCPETIEDAKEIAIQMKEQKPVVVNLEFTDLKSGQRITDFLCGCCYAVNGKLSMISDRIFMIVPSSVDFAGDVDLREKLQNESGIMIPWHE